MLKLLIVDDNDFERKALSNYINWDVLGIQLVDTAYNGQDAVEKAKLHRPEIIISDVKMPVMDGLEMAKIIKILYPETKFIFSSAHEDVALLKEALEIRAFNYIIKPINPDELVDTVKRVVSVIIDEKLANMENNSIIKQFAENLSFLQSKFLTGIILKERNTDEMNELYNQANKLKLRIIGAYRLILLDMDYENDDGFETSFKNNAVIDELRSACAGEKVIFMEVEHNKIVAVIYHLDEKQSREEKIVDIIAEKLMTVKADFSFKYTLGISTRTDSLTGLHTLFKECNAAVEKKIERGYNQIIHFQKAENVIAESKEENMDAIKRSIARIVDMVFEGKEFNEELESIMSQIPYIPGSKLDNTKSILISLLNSISKHMENNGENMDKVVGDAIHVYNHIISSKIIPDIIQYVSEILEAISSFLVGKKTGKDDYIVEVILNILKNEFNQPITLTYLSGRVFLSSNYLRLLFKNKMGISIQDYLTNVRINKAKDLLKQMNYKIHEIGEMVGYTNSTYFNIIFKNHSHFTPGEYRNKYLSGEKNRD
jgi:two-component system, response regulator YesN